MAAAQSNQPDEPPYLSFKELRSNEERVLFSPAAKRLYWNLEGVFSSAISVMRTARTVGELDPFFIPDTRHQTPAAAAAVLAPGMRSRRCLLPTQRSLLLRLHYATLTNGSQIG